MPDDIKGRAPTDDARKARESANEYVPTSIERIAGSGTVYHGSTRMMDVGYDLIIVPPELRGLTYGPGVEPSSSPLPDITGQLQGALFKAEDLEGPQTLVLEDGRAFDFRVIQPDTNEIIGVSPIRRP